MLELPDWEHWGRLRTMSMRDTLVLSIGLCPHKYNHEKTDATELSYAQKYWDNLQIAKNHVYESDWLVGRVAKQEGDVDTTYTEVDFEKFCVWAASVLNLADLPPEMLAIGNLLLEDTEGSSVEQRRGRNKSNGDDWKTLAREIAKELRASSTARHYFLSLDKLAARIEKIFAERDPPVVGINNHRLIASTIKRHALIGLFKKG